MINLPNASQSFKEKNPSLFGKANPQEQQQQVPKGSIKRGKNKTEAEFELMLKAEYPSDIILFESIKFRLGDKCWYTPDFVRIGYIGVLHVYEVKGGHIWDDSKVKFKCAKEQFPKIEFQMFQKKKGKWSQIL